MKKAFFIILVLFSFFQANCQEKKDLIDVRFGLSFCGSGDMYGKTLGISYSKPLTSLIDISPYVDYSGFKQIVQLNSTIAAYALSGGISLSVHSNRNRRLILFSGLSINLNNYSWNLVTSSNSLEIKGIRLDPYSQTSFNEKIGVGYRFVTGFRIKVNHFCPGLSYHFQNDTNGNVFHSMQFALTFNL